MLVCVYVLNIGLLLYLYIVLLFYYYNTKYYISVLEEIVHHNVQP